MPTSRNKVQINLTDALRSWASLLLEMLALRQQLAMVANCDSKRLRFRQSGGCTH